MAKQEEQFTQIPNSLMSNKDLTDQDKLTLGLILSFIKNDKECFIGNEWIAERMGITKNAASIRINRLAKLGCISLRYVKKSETNKIEKRFITVLTTAPKVSSEKLKVSSDRRKGIVPQTKGYSPVDEGVSSKQGGIIQDILNNRLDKVLDKVLDKEFEWLTSKQIQKLSAEELKEYNLQLEKEISKEAEKLKQLK